MLSFVYVGIYWNNHHHLVHALEHGASGAILWANLHLLFWLSLFPFATAWMGENEFAPMPTAVYGVVLLMAAIAYWLLERAIIAADGPSSVLRRAVGKDWKGTLSPLFYVAAIALDVLVAMGRGDALRARRTALADPGSAHRARAQAPSSHMKRRKHL